MAPAVVSRMLHRMSQSHGDKDNYDDKQQRDQEKQQLADWEANKEPLEVDEITKDPQKKVVGHSSKYLRKEDFELVKTLGTGTFARVWLAKIANRKASDNNKVFALKILRKTDVIRLKQVEHVRNERNVLAAVAGHPFITTMVASFQDSDTLYMVLDYCPGGEVFSYLRRARRFNEPTSQFYAAEIVLILEFLHEKEGVAYRDLKPENILIDAEGHLKLVDFGFAKKIESRETYTLCGTPEYLAPEVIRNTGHGTAVDWWAFGILIYEFLVGQPPFWDQNPMKIYEQIVEGKVRYPSAMSEDARSIIAGLCEVDVAKRLGNVKGGAATVKAQPWFKNIDWDALYHRKMQGPIVPHLRSADDTRNFDEYDAEPVHRDPYTKTSIKECGLTASSVISRHQRAQLSYDELDRKSNALARGLQGIGVKKGDRVAVSLGNNTEFAITTYALFKLGAILNPLNPSFNVQQVISATSHLEASHLIIGTETNLSRKPPRSNVQLLEHIAPGIRSGKLESEVVPSLKGIVLVDNSSGRVNANELKATVPFEDVLSGSGQSLSDQGLHKDDVVNIQFTSGTTSMPKAACLSHRSILNNGTQIGDRMLLTSKDVVCCPPPLFHCFGCILGYMATATHGSAIVFPTEAFDPLATLKAVQEYKATALYGVATMFLAELELLADGTVPYEGFQYLRTGIAAGSSVPAELMRKLHKILNLHDLTICYGMTETSPVSVMTSTDDPIQKRIETVGRMMPHVEAKVVDVSDRSKTLGLHERGELAVSGYLLMKEYWGDPVKTAEAMIPDHEDPSKIWMLTGDEASMDEEGYVSITGRIKDLIIRGGENIHPLEVENCLLAHDHVWEVSVVGLPDEKYGEVVAAFVVPRPDSGLTADVVRSWVREKLSGHLVPKYVFWVNDYPKTASGKIQKFKLQENGVKLLRDGKGLQ
ncbi:hypothetical protein LTR97_000198 [Elasticomyces elasticus]|uniref:cAMP-dependent protein kinase n=1 Tax=Elasticomyces elasticus TaxID=574655 RepID=A0AAN8A5E0_9PEZI|nr:hypothetical protein LTR97_000198 [Elasticomyces elasticus]